MSNDPWNTYGPYVLPKKSRLSWKDRFRDCLGMENPLCDAAGVYVIGIRHGSNYRIKYIGMTYEQGFFLEIFSQRNMSHVWNNITKERSGGIVIWLLAKPKKKHSGFSFNKSMKNQSFLLETLLIMHAKAAGQQLINTSKMKSASGIAVIGLFGAKKKGALPVSVTSLAGALNL